MSAETVSVNAEALYSVLTALNGGGHLIRELQVTRGMLFPDNPIDVLINQYNAWVKQHNEAAKAGKGGDHEQTR